MNGLTIKARTIARNIGLLPLLQRMRPRGPYEAEFGKAMLDAVRAGDVVWDVGANVGFYTQQFIAKAGPTGKVVAFEPEPSCYAILQRDCASAIAVNCALSDQAGEGFLEAHPQADAGTHHIVGERTNTSIAIKLIAGDNYEGPCPNVIKIDVEGFEDEVLAGIPRILADRRLRAIFVEVHFALLERRGKALAPVLIERKLQGLGFRTSWFRDRSHLKALRGN
jgi:FkbM family methyltransferase